MSNDPNDRRDSDDRRDSNEGGLFSDDYEAPKRENPYLKKNREKAAREAAERAAREEAARAEKAAREEAKRAKKAEDAARAEAAKVSRASSGDTRLSDADKPSVDEATAEGGGYKRRRTFSDFMFEHIKLITTIVTACLILSLVLITDVMSVVEDIITASQQADKEYISLTYVEGMTELAEPITWGHVSKFRRETNATKSSVTWVLEVEGTSYEVWISGVDTAHPPTYARLYDMKTGDHMDLNKDDFATFVAEHP